MISVVIILVRDRRTWQISRCAVNFGDRRIRACPCPTRRFSSPEAAIDVMKHRAMQYVRGKGYTDSPLDIEWHIAVADPSGGQRDRRHV